MQGNEARYCERNCMMAKMTWLRCWKCSKPNQLPDARVKAMTPFACEHCRELNYIVLRFVAVRVQEAEGGQTL